MIKILKKIFKQKDLTLTELNSFIFTCTEKAGKEDPTPEQLQGIVHLFQRGYFDKILTAKKLAYELDYQVIELQDLRTGQIIRRDVYKV